MDEDDGSEQPPGAALAVDVEHAQNLEEPDPADRGCRKHLAIRPHRQHHDRGTHHNEI